MRALLVFLSFGFWLAACAPTPPANIDVWSADFVSPTDWYQTNITSGRVYFDYSSPDISTHALWAGANGVNKIQECSVNNSTFGYYGPQGDCSQMECVQGRSGGLCWCNAPCDAYALLCDLETATYSGPCKIRGVTGDSWKVIGEVFVCMSQGKPLGLTAWDSYDVVVEFSNFSTSVPESTWQLPAYCSKSQGAPILGEKK